jgi:hypothetical protein
MDEEPGWDTKNPGGGQMSTGCIKLLAQQMKEAYEILRGRLHGITEDEYFWEPVPQCWTIFQQADGRWTYHYELPPPQPHPFTTLGWRVSHIALCKVMYHEYAFGAREITWETIETPPTPADALEVLERGQHLLVQDLSTLSKDEELNIPRLTNWGEEWPTWRIFWTLIHHDAHHGGEIGCIRDLYLRRQRLGHDAHSQWAG